MAFRHRTYQPVEKPVEHITITQIMPPQQEHPITRFRHQRPLRNPSKPSHLTSASAAPQFFNTIPKLNETHPNFILLKHPDKLTKLEQEEIVGFEKIYYFGQNAQKNYNMTKTNYGYDDSEGDVKPVLKDHVSYRYELLQLLGQGSFGKVFRAIDHLDKSIVALKMLKNRKRFRKQGLVELKLLQTLKDNDPNNENYCIRIKNKGEFRSHIYFVTEILECDLYALLCKNNLQGLHISQIKKFAQQSLKCIKFSNELGIIHADIKPENILISKNGDIQIIDWGSGAFVGQTIYTYIQSRYYRAPEVILGLPYSTPIDVWSLGCVLCELLTGQPIFPGEDENDQLGKICEFLGIPDSKTLALSPRRTDFFWSAGNSRILLRTNHKVGKSNFSQIIGNGGSQFVDLIKKMLVLDPIKRSTPEQLLVHEFFTNNLELPALLTKQLK
eukprot:EST44551.1 Kinase, CMGC DYRK [Spironucleus salmonicida]